ncbi:Rpl2, partial [Rhynchospora pubera]
FIAAPLTTGRLPSQHFDPALPKLFRVTPTLPTCPTVAKQFWDIKRTSPDGNLNVADLPSFAISFALAPAALANCPPFPCLNSMLCMVVPKGIPVERRFRFGTCFKQFSPYYHISRVNNSLLETTELNHLLP